MTITLDSASVKNIALSDKVGKAKIYLPSSLSIDEETTATLRGDSWQARKAHDEIEVCTTTLDELLQPSIDNLGRLLIKIDVEDFEANVLKGGLAVLMKSRPIIVVEVLPRDHANLETAEILENAGYITYGVSGSGLIRFDCRDFAGDRTFTDFLCVPSEFCAQGNYFSYKELALIAKN